MPDNVVAQEGDTIANTTVPLTYRSARKWNFTLPENRWNRIGTSLVIGDRKFKVEVEGLALLVDTDGDGKTDVKVEGKSAFLSLKGDGFQHSVRLRNRKGWIFASAAYLNGKIDGKKVKIFDLDNNGRFGDVGKDGIILGNGKRVSHLGNSLHLGKKLIALSVADDGRSLSYEPYAGKTGKLQLDYSTKGKVMSLRIRSSDGLVNFDLSDLARTHGAALDLPVGTYKLHGGEIGLGDNQVKVGPGRSKPFEVKEGHSVPLNLGGVIKAEFTYARSGDKVQMSPDKVWYYGPAGEEYQAWAPIGKSPTFTIRDKDSGNELARAFFPGTC